MDTEKLGLGRMDAPTSSPEARSDPVGQETYTTRSLSPSSTTLGPAPPLVAKRDSDPIGQDLDDDAPVCRICRLGSSEGGRLFHPCKCSGSIKFVHEACLSQWLKHSGNTCCEVGWGSDA